MKFRNKAVELATITAVCVLLYVVIGAAFRLVEGHWPSNGFWFGGVLVYFLVTLPAIRRGWKKAQHAQRIADRL